MKNLKNVCKVLVSITILWSINSNAYSELNTDKQNEDSISALDKLITQSSTVSSPAYSQTTYTIDYSGKNGGEECLVQIKRIDYLKSSTPVLQLHYYGVAIYKNGEVCETNMSYTHDLDKNTDSSVKWKQSYILPKLISNRYNSLNLVINGEQLEFKCRNYAKANPGYVIGVDQKASCTVEFHNN